jgi:hypothetical protein
MPTEKMSTPTFAELLGGSEAPMFISSLLP